MLIKQMCLDEEVKHSTAQKFIYGQKVKRIEETIELIKGFGDWISESKWDKRFDIKMSLFLDQVADANLRIFMGQASAKDTKVKQYQNVFQA